MFVQPFITQRDRFGVGFNRTLNFSFEFARRQHEHNDSRFQLFIHASTLDIEHLVRVEY